MFVTVLKCLPINFIRFIKVCLEKLNIAVYYLKHLRYISKVFSGE